ncbi:MAG: hypothetical protein ACREVZ_01275 [Burkholderiales bacterium]
MPLPLTEPERICITDKSRSPRTLLIRVEVWLCRWWSEAREQGRNAEAAAIWEGARAVSRVAASLESFRAGRDIAARVTSPGAWQVPR